MKHIDRPKNHAYVFGRFFLDEHKHLVVEYSLRVGKILVGLFEQACGTR